MVPRARRRPSQARCRPLRVAAIVFPAVAALLFGASPAWAYDHLLFGASPAWAYDHLFLDAGPGWAHDHAAVDARPLAVLVFLRGVAVLAGLIAAGMALTGSTGGGAAGGARTLFRATAITSVAAQLGAGSIAQRWQPAALASVVVMVAVLVGGSRPRLGPVIGGCAVALLALFIPSTVPDASLGAAGPGRWFALASLGAAVLYAFGAGLWAGVAGRLATVPLAAKVDRARGTLVPVAATACMAVATAAEALLPVAYGGGWPAPDGPIAFRVALLGVGVAGLAWWWVGGHRLAGVGLAGAVAAGTALVSAWSPAAAAAVPGTPLLRHVSVGGVNLPVFVVPGRPGPNLVQIGIDGASAGTARDPLVSAGTARGPLVSAGTARNDLISVGTARDRLTPVGPRAGSASAWAEIVLRAGRNDIWIGYGDTRARLRIDAGRGGPAPGFSGGDAPECVAAALGAAVANAAAVVRDCPADNLRPVDADALRATVGFIAARGVTAIALVSDLSPRAVAARRVVEEAAEAAGMAVTHPGPTRAPLVVVSGWATAADTVRAVSTGDTVAEGTYLAPWLFNSALLSAPAGQLLPLRLDPGGLVALRYVEELHRHFPAEPPSHAGYHGWLAGAGQAADQPLRLYAAARVNVPGNSGHNHQADRWLTEGTVTAISGPLEPVPPAGP